MLVQFFLIGNSNPIFAENNFNTTEIKSDSPKKKIKKRKNVTNRNFIKNSSKNGSSKNSITGKRGKPHTKPAKIFLSHHQAKKQSKKRERATNRNRKHIKR